MTQIEQIKAEIERLKSCKLNFEEDTEYLRGYDFAIDTIKEFINSIPSEKQSGEDLEKFIQDLIEKYPVNKESVPNDNLNYYYQGLCFGALQVAHWQKEQMMKDAVNGIMDCDDDNEWIEITDKLIVTPSRAGEKVKMYIFMEDEK